MPISPDCERVPSAGIATDNPDASRETIPVPPDCERVPGSHVTAGATDASWQAMSIPPDRAHIPGASVAAGAPGPDWETIPTPSDCERVPGTGGDASDPFIVVYYVDGNILIEVRCKVPWIASGHFRLLGPRGPREHPLLKAHTILGWTTHLEVLGWVVDTDKLIISLSPCKRSKVWQTLADWPHSRHSATCKQIVELTGFLLHVSVAVRPRKFFVQRLLAHATMPLCSAAGFSSSSKWSRRLVSLALSSTVTSNVGDGSSKQA